MEISGEIHIDGQIFFVEVIGEDQFLTLINDRMPDISQIITDQLPATVDLILDGGGGNDPTRSEYLEWALNHGWCRLNKSGKNRYISRDEFNPSMREWFGINTIEITWKGDAWKVFTNGKETGVLVRQRGVFEGVEVWDATTNIEMSRVAESLQSKTRRQGNVLAGPLAVGGVVGHDICTPRGWPEQIASDRQHWGWRYPILNEELEGPPLNYMVARRWERKTIDDLLEDVILEKYRCKMLPIGLMGIIEETRRWGEQENEWQADAHAPDKILIWAELGIAEDHGVFISLNTMQPEPPIHEDFNVWVDAAAEDTILHTTAVTDYDGQRWVLR